MYHHREKNLIYHPKVIEIFNLFDQHPGNFMMKHIKTIEDLSFTDAVYKTADSVLVTLFLGGGGGNLKISKN